MALYDIAVPPMGASVPCETEVPWRAASCHMLSTAPVVVPIDTSRMWPQQVEGSHWLRAINGNALLAFEQRCGKTGTALRALPWRGRTIVVCPLTARLGWRDAIRADHPPCAPHNVPNCLACYKDNWRPDLTTRLASSGDSIAPAIGEVVITNFEALPEPLTKTILVADNLLDVHLIVDEAEAVNNPDADRTRKVRALAHQVYRTWGLTGTPMPGTEMHLWGLLETLRLHRLAFGSFKKFLAMTGGQKAKGKGFGPAYEFLPDVDREPVRKALKKVMLRKTRAEVFPDMPAKVYADIPVDIGNAFEGAETVEEDWRKWQLLGATTLPPFELLQGALKALAKAKIPAMIEQVRHHEDLGLPLLVFSAHLEPLAELERREGWAVITGATDPDERENIRIRFQAGALKGVGCSIKACKTAIDLSAASDELFVSRSYVPTENEQAEDRGINGNKTVALNVNILVADHPIERRILEILRAKKVLITDIIG